MAAIYGRVALIGRDLLAVAALQQQVLDAFDTSGGYAAIVQTRVGTVTLRDGSSGLFLVYNELNLLVEVIDPLGNSETYQYDLNGNQTGWDHVQNGTRRTITWDEENRIQAVADNGQTQTYRYDDAGERVIKRGAQGETAYVNQFWTVRNREVVTKHIFAGGTRLVSKLGRQPRGQVSRPADGPAARRPVDRRSPPQLEGCAELRRARRADTGIPASTQ